MASGSRIINRNLGQVLPTTTNPAAADTTVPSAPVIQNIQVTNAIIGGARITVVASTDNVAVAEYVAYTNKLGEIGRSESNSINVSRLEIGANAIYVKAIDSSGNASLESSVVNCVMPVPTNYQSSGVVKLSAPLNVLTYGPSISAYGFWNSAANNKNYFNGESELANAFMHTGPLMMPKIIGGATARTDICGNYGYPAQTSDTLLTDSESLWIPQLAAASFVPDLIIYTGLVVNDIAAGVPFGTIMRTVRQILAAHKARWPSLVQLLTTPHPDSRPNAAQKVVFRQVRDAFLLMDNNADLLVADLCGSGSYVGPDGVAPLPYYAYTNSMGNVNALADTDGVHPNGRGAQINGWLIAKRILERFGPVTAPLPATFRSTNIALTGSATLTGTGNSGNAPANASQANALGAGASCVSSVTGYYPWEVALTPENAVNDIVVNGSFTLRMSTGTSGGANPHAMFAKVKVLSGAESIAQLIGVLTTNEGTNGNLADWSINNPQYPFYAGYAGGTVQGIRDSDELYLMTPLRARSVAPITEYHDIYIRLGKPNTTVKLAILQTGFLAN